jgi:hypothetical protein
MRTLTLALVLAFTTNALAEPDPIIGVEVGYDLAPGLAITDGRGTDTAFMHRLAYGWTMIDDGLVVDFDLTGMMGTFLSALTADVLPAAGKPTPTDNGTNMVVSKYVNLRGLFPLDEEGGDLRLAGVFDLGFGARGLTNDTTTWADPDLAGGHYLGAGGGVGAIWQPSEALLLTASATLGAHASTTFQFGGGQLYLEGEAIFTLAPNLFWLKAEVSEETWLMGNAFAGSTAATTHSNLQCRVSIINNIVGWCLSD